MSIIIPRPYRSDYGSLRQGCPEAAAGMLYNDSDSPIDYLCGDTDELIRALR